MRRPALALAACALALPLVAAMLELPPPSVDLRALVDARMHESGVIHPVTAVLLNFRGYDTLLEIGVLLLALLAALAVRGEAAEAGPPLLAEPVLGMLARIAAPPMVVLAVYLLWAGAHRPGGAFQAGAVLAASAVLLHLTGVVQRWAQPGRRMRAGLTAGLFIFLGVAVVPLLEGSMLQYPPRRAGELILLVESGLTVSLGLILAGLFLFMPRDGGP